MGKAFGWLAAATLLILAGCSGDGAVPSAPTAAPERSATPLDPTPPPLTSTATPAPPTATPTITARRPSCCEGVNYCRGTGAGAGFFCGAAETPFDSPHICSDEGSRCKLPTPTVTPTRTCARVPTPVCDAGEDVLCDDRRCTLGCSCATHTPTPTVTQTPTCYPTPNCGSCFGTYCDSTDLHGCPYCYCEGNPPPATPTGRPDVICTPPFERRCAPFCHYVPDEEAACECVFVARTPTPPAVTPTPAACIHPCTFDVCDGLSKVELCDGGSGCRCVPLEFEECSDACGTRPCGQNGLVVCPGGGYGEAVCTTLDEYGALCGCVSHCPSPTPA